MDILVELKTWFNNIFWEKKKIRTWGCFSRVCSLRLLEGFLFCSNFQKGYLRRLVELIGHCWDLCATHLILDNLSNSSLRPILYVQAKALKIEPVYIYLKVRVSNIAFRKIINCVPQREFVRKEPVKLDSLKILKLKSWIFSRPTPEQTLHLPLS